MTTAPNPGINSKAALWHLDQDERRIIDHFSKEWLVTSVGPINLGSSSNYKFALLKPTIQYQDMFNLEREIIAIFSPYNEFQPRSLDAIDEVYERHQKLRVERVCTILFSRDNEIESKLQNILKNDKEAQIVVPFSYQDFNEPLGNYFIRSRFRKHFYTRDLFAFESPLRSDRYFFGRTDLIHVITNRHRSNENSGLFGLRKTGKTSVIFGITRALSLTEDRFVVIDCQNTAFHRRRWNKALYYIISETKHQNNINTSTHSEQEYTEEDAAILFEKDIINIYKIFEEKSIMIVFDEIENITFNVSPSEHWANGLDFVFFWQTLRSLFQKQNRVFSYLIVGTNPMCVEAPIIQGKDNPIFNQIPFQYMPRFDVPQTREMVRKLGRIMGLKFEEIIYGRLTEDFGGHPYLIRHVCSIINGNRSRGREGWEWDERWGRASRPIGGNRVRHEGEQMLLLFPTGRADTQDTLHKAVPLGAVRPKTALPPQHGTPQRLFRCVIGRLDPVLSHKRPQRRFMHQQLLAHAFGRVTPPCPMGQQGVDGRLNRCQRALQGGAIDGAFAKQMPQSKHQLTERQEVGTPHARRPTAIDQRLKITLQMRPAQLMAVGGQCQVGTVAIRAHNPPIVCAQQMAQPWPGPAGQHRETGGNGRDHRPQPAPCARFFPAGFIDIAARFLLHGRVDGGIDRGQGGTAHLLQRHHAAQAERHPKTLGQQPRHLPITEVIVAMQDGHGGSEAGAKCTGRYRGGAGRFEQVATAGAGDGMILMCGNLGTHDRQFPDILGVHGRCIRAIGRHQRLTGRARGGKVIDGRGNLIGGGLGAVSPRMAGLRPRVPAPRHAWGTGRSVGWVSGRRFG